MHLVRSMFSNAWTSINTDAYVDLLSTVPTPWYYQHYRRMHVPDSRISIPCDMYLRPVSRHILSDSDRMLYRLHVRATISWKRHQQPYWICDPMLAHDFDRLWHGIVSSDGKNPIPDLEFLLKG